jgi:hypothetical protein
MDTINNILLSRLSLCEAYKDDQKDRGLADYAQRVLDTTLNAPHAAAVAYVKLGFCTGFQLYSEVEDLKYDSFVYKGEGIPVDGIPVDFGFIQNEALWAQWRAPPPITHPVCPYFEPDHQAIRDGTYARKKPPTAFVQVTEIQGDQSLNKFRLRYGHVYHMIPTVGNQPPLLWISPHSIKRYLDFLVEQDERRHN